MTGLAILLLYTYVALTAGQGPACTGQTLGEANPSFSTATAGPNTGNSYILLDDSMVVPCCGVVTQWIFASKAAGTFTGQVWRKDVGNKYKVLGETDVTGVVADSVYRQGVAANLQTSVEQDDRLGWYSSAADIVPYIPTGSAVMGRVAEAGKTSVSNPKTWPNTRTNGERWMFGAVLEKNTAPDFGTSLPASVTAVTADSVPLGRIVHTIALNDDNTNDIDGLIVTIIPVHPEFELAANKRDVIIKAALKVGEYKVVFEVVDHCLETGTATLTVTVTDNRAEIISLPVAAALLREDAPSSVLPLHTLVFTDDGPLTDVKCSMVYISPASGPIVMKYIPGTSDYGMYFVRTNANSLNHDTTPLYEMSVTCNDGTSDSVSKVFQVSIEENEEPVPVIPTEIEVSAKTTKNGTLVHTFTSTDPENDKVIYTMDCTCPFIMFPNGEMHSTANLNDHRNSPYVVTINVTDPYSSVGPTTVTLKIIDRNNPPIVTDPTKTYPAVDTVFLKEHTDEGNPHLTGTDTLVFTAAGTDPDKDDLLTWEFTFDNGQGEDLFVYDSDAGTITTKKDIDYEYLSDNGLLSTRVEVRAFDGREFSETSLLNIVVTDVNEGPKLSQKLYSVETFEGTGTGTIACLLFDVTDVDNPDTRKYDIDCGASGAFQIPTGARTTQCEAYLVQTEQYDLDSPGAESKLLTCIVTETDKGGLTTTATLEILIKAEDDNTPLFTKTSYEYTINNDSSPEYKFGNADAIDKDFVAEHKRLTYSTDSNYFGIDDDGIFCTLKDWTGTNADPPIIEKFNVMVTDDAGHSDTVPVTVTIIDVPDVTTTTTTTTTLPDVYSGINSFWDVPGNLAWAITAMLLGIAALGLMGFLIYKCCTVPNACASIARTCRNTRCCEGSRRVRGNRAPPRNVVRSEPPRRETPRREPTLKQKEKESSWNCFKRRPPPPQKDDGNRTWHLWNHGDFKSPEKWVG